ncbi:uncharacterized protein si:dkey-21a6.5 isoform X1 [Alosa alosa]|uniref:uncharacterized protein si:dkey-21a6.5 isoform X1 n=1 Tax=Alosa alosa TaxID=278164 RepID=UPI00201554B4|nr:uncharacterized protein si:dkey-21a6.5 isoform X1 [Alosa alosa]
MPQDLPPAAAVPQGSMPPGKMPHHAVPVLKEPTASMHKDPVQLLCQICSSGFYQIRWGQASCDVCPENHYCPSPDVSPIQCPADAFCPEGSTAPGYCMETFFRKVGETCELAPVTIALLVIGGGGVAAETRGGRGAVSVTCAAAQEGAPCWTLLRPALRRRARLRRLVTPEPLYAGW